MGKITTKKRILFSFRGQVTINGQIMSEKPGIFCAQNGQKLWVFGQPEGRDACLLSMCVGTAFIEETDSETAEGIVQELLMEAMGQGIFGKEQGEKFLISVKEVYRLRDNGSKDMDADIKILTDKITSHPEQELLIETLAADIFVSKYYLIRKFKSSIGMTPHQFCIQNRIRKSQGLLDEEKTVSRIAAEMGFYDQSHFDKAFQRIVGISPSEYIHSKKLIGQST